MKASQINLISSFRARRVVLTNETATSKRPAFKAALAALDKQFEEIDELTLAQSQPLSAALAERDESLDEMTETALGLAGAAFNYAEDQGLTALAFRLRLKPGDFSRLRMERRVPIARYLHEAIDPVVAQLADYGVTPAALADFKTKIDTAEVALSAPRGTVVDKKAATARLGAAVRNAGAIFRHRIDPLVRSLRDTDPDFYARYQAAQTVVSRPGTRSADEPPEAETTVATPASATLASAPLAA